MEPREGREEEERGSEGGRRGEAHNAMGHGGWTDSICSQLSVALVMDGELERRRESGKEGDGEIAGGKAGRKRGKRQRLHAREYESSGANKSNFLLLFPGQDTVDQCVCGGASSIQIEG